MSMRTSDLVHNCNSKNFWHDSYLTGDWNYASVLCNRWMLLITFPALEFIYCIYSFAVSAMNLIFYYRIGFLPLVTFYVYNFLPFSPFKYFGLVVFPYLFPYVLIFLIILATVSSARNCLTECVSRNSVFFIIVYECWFIQVLLINLNNRIKLPYCYYLLTYLASRFRY
jgi:hypothetical protein